MPKFWPQSLFGRNLLLLLALATVAQASTLGVFILMQQPRVIEVARMLATQINTLDGALSQVPTSDRENYIARVNRLGRFIVQVGNPPKEQEGPPKGFLARLFIDTVNANLANGTSLRVVDGQPPRLWVHVSISDRHYWITMPIGVVLQYRWLTSALATSLCMALLATIAALLIQRRINRPLRDIADAAQKLGAGGKPERLPAYSTHELAVVAEQFNTMSDSLEEMETTRAVMLAGISHDIRTPLTKLRLALAMDSHMSEQPIIQYIDQIDMIVGQFVDFGRTGSDEALIEGDINTLILQLAAEFSDRGHPFQLTLGKLPPLRFRPIAMMRVVSNLMENAVKYGMLGLEVRTWIEREQVLVAVLDRGPGLPLGEEVRLLRPFARADSGRSGISGSGLGLAIVDRLIRLHGGRLQLNRRTCGGLEACVVLPCFQSPTTG